MGNYIASFHILAIVNGAVMNTGVHVSFPTSFLQTMPQSVFWLIYQKLFNHTGQWCHMTFGETNIILMQYTDQ